MTRAIHPFAKAAISLVICLLLVISCLLPAHAASCYISLSASDGKVGDTVGLSVYASGDIAAATITISYDTTILQYAGGDGSDNYGSVTFDGEHSSGGGDLSFYASFTAIASGQANFSVVGYDVVDSGANNMDVSYDSSYSAISAPSTASSDSSLASLSVGSGSLSPAFSSGTTEYSLYVGNDTDYLSISASPNDGGAYVYVSDQNLAEGDNAIYVTVTAEDGVSSTTYSIYVYREYADGSENRDDEDEDEDTEDGVAYADLTDGREMEIIDFDDEDLPNGFTRSTLKFDGVTVPVGVNAASGQYIVWLSDEDADDTFWLFDAASGIAQPISWLPESATQYLILSLPAEELPEGYKTVSAKIGGVDVQVLSAADAPSVNHYIVYAMNSSGNTGFYLYDIDEGTFQRYNFAVLAEVQPSPSPSPSTSPSPTPTPTPTPAPTASPAPSPVPEVEAVPWYVTYFAYLVIGAAVVFAGLLIWAVYATVRFVQLKREEEDKSMYIPVRSTPAAPAAAENTPVTDVPAAEPVIPNAPQEDGELTVPELPDGEVPADGNLDFSLDDILKEYSGAPSDEDS